jgi:hypothetical protein
MKLSDLSSLYSLIIVSFVMIVGCATETHTSTTERDILRLHVARLTGSQAAQIASEAAEKQGYRLTNYDAPFGMFYKPKFSRHRASWHIIFPGKDGHTSLVVGIIDDQTGETHIEFAPSQIE